MGMGGTVYSIYDRLCQRYHQQYVHTVLDTFNVTGTGTGTGTGRGVA